MRVSAALIILFLTASKAFSQSPVSDSVTMGELTMKTYDKDSSAEAVCLFDFGDARIDNGTIFNVHYRFKILKKTDNYAKYADVRIFSDRNTLKKLKASTYNLINGKIVRSDVKESEIHHQKEGKDTEQVIVAMPNVVEGSVIDVSYSLQWLGNRMPYWNFQRSIPVIWSEYKIANWVSDFQIDYRGNPKFKIQESTKKDRIQRWVMTDVPAFKPEPMMLDETVYRMAVKFWPLNMQWGEIAEYLQDYRWFGSILISDNDLSMRADALTHGVSDPLKKIENITTYVKKQITWDGTEDFYGDNPIDVFKKKEGSSGDINLILGSLLKKAGFDVTMVLVRTRGLGIPLQHVVDLRQFNYVICRVKLGESELFLDATEPKLPFNQLPEHCLNHLGLLMDWRNPAWISIEQKTKEKRSLNADLTLGEQGSLTGKFRVIEEGYAALQTRQQVKPGSVDKKASPIIANKPWDVKNYRIANYDTVSRPVQESFDVEISDQTTVTNNKIFINPFLGFELKYDFLTNNERLYPIDLVVPQDNTIICSISIPAGFELEAIPEGKVIRLDNSAKCTFNFARVGNRVIATRSIQINKTIFMPEEYHGLKDFYSRIISKNGEQLIVKKKM